MKKIIPVILCMIFIFAGCSAKEAPKDALAENYVGEGQMTVLRYLINSNAFFVEEVFVENSLPTESGKDITNENGTFAPVASDDISTYGELRQTLEATYTKEAADKILAEYGMYTEIDGKLYLSTGHSADAEDYDWSTPEIEVISVSDGTYVLEVTIKNGNGWKHKLDVKAVTVDGNIRLENMYY